MLRPALIAVIGMALSTTAIAPALSATSQRPPRPTVYTVAPEKHCEVITVTTVDGEKAKRLAPPAPGIRAVALSPRRVRVFWRFATLPRACRPTNVAIVIARYGEGLPTVRYQAVNGRLSGSKVLDYSTVYKPPDVAWVSSISTSPRPYSSRNQMVLIRK